MELQYQVQAISELEKLSKTDSHSILLEGIRGCGKTYLASRFAAFKNISTFHVINPKVSDLKNLIENSLKLQDSQVICIENLDEGTNAASQVVLKYLEEPAPNVFIIVTCINSSKLPDTINSRVISVQVNHPSFTDLVSYAENLDKSKYSIISDFSAFKACKSLSDVKSVLDMSLDNLNYVESEILTVSLWSKSIDTITWNLGHYPSGSPTNLKLVLRCLNQSKNLNSRVHKEALKALISLESKNISEFAVLSKFVLDVKIGS